MIVDFDWYPSESSHFSHPVIKVCHDIYVLGTQRHQKKYTLLLVLRIRIRREFKNQIVCISLFGLEHLFLYIISGCVSLRLECIADRNRNS